MKWILVLISILLVSIINCFSQQELVWGDFYLGPFISHKAGLNNTQVYSGEKKIIRINSIPDFGVSNWYFFNESQNTGIIMELGLSTYSFKHAFPFDESKFMSYQSSNITLFVCCYLWDFSFGPTIGFPIIWYLYVNDRNIFIKQTKSLFFEGINLSYYYNILKNGGENLNLNLNFQLNYITADQFTEVDSTMGYKSVYKPFILSFGIGLNYLFKLTD